MNDVPSGYRDLGDGQPPIHDWPARVRGAVRRRRRVRQGALAGGAAVLIVPAALVLALGGTTPSAPQVLAQETPTPEPTVALTQQPSPAPHPTTTESATPAAPTETPTAEVSATSSPTPSPTSLYTSRPQNITLRIKGPIDVTVGQTVTYQAIATGDASKPEIYDFCVVIQRCADPAVYRECPQQPTEPPTPGETFADDTVRFKDAGTTSVDARAADCTGYPGSASAHLTITVHDAPSPTPTVTPSEEPSPTPTP